MISNSNIKKYKNGEDFEIEHDGKIFQIEAISLSDFLYYFNVFDDWRVFKILPNGNEKGTVNELPWILDLIKYFSRIEGEIESFLLKKK